MDVLLNLQAGRAELAPYEDPLAAPKRAHMIADVMRLSRYYKIDIQMPQPSRQNTRTALAIMNQIAGNSDIETKLRDRLFRAHWERQQDIGSPETLASILKEIAPGVDLLDDKGSELIQNTKSNYDKDNVFGVPTFVSENGLYFGLDRLNLLLREMGLPASDSLT